MASLRIFFLSVSSTLIGTPPTASSGEAAPVCVPGAMAAMSAESRMKNPAEAPREAVGQMYTDDRNRRGENVLDDFLHRGLQAAGRIHGDQDQGRLFARGLVDALGDVFGHDGLDSVGDVQLDDARGANGGRTLRRSGHATGEKQTCGQGYEQ